MALFISIDLINKKTSIKNYLMTEVPDTRILDWLTDWLIDWLIDWLLGWLTDWLINCLVDSLIWLIGGWVDGWIYGFMDLWIDWWIDWLIDWLISLDFPCVQEGQVEQLGEGLAAEAEKSLTNLLCFNMERVIRLACLIMIVFLIRF